MPTTMTPTTTTQRILQAAHGPTFRAMPVVHQQIASAITELRSLMKETPYPLMVEPMIRAFQSSHSNALLEHQLESLMQFPPLNMPAIEAMRKRMDDQRYDILLQLGEAWRQYNQYGLGYGD